MVQRVLGLMTLRPMSWLVQFSDSIDDVWDMDDPLLRD